MTEKEKKYLYERVMTQLSRDVKHILLEKGIKTGGAKITNAVDNRNEYDTVAQITNDTDTQYVDNYGNSYKLLDTLRKCNLLENDHGDGGVLYKNGWQGVLTYWLTFSRMDILCRFLVAFNKYAEKFSYEKVRDGQWHMSFDIHDDPLTGVDNKTVTYLLEYKSKTTKLDEIDKAVDELCEEIEKHWNN